MSIWTYIFVFAFVLLSVTIGHTLFNNPLPNPILSAAGALALHWVIYGSKPTKTHPEI